MRWEAPSIAAYAQGAGFGRPDLHTATAIALAGSGGIDHYDVAAGAPGTGRWVGLWALNVDEWPEFPIDQLLTPDGAAGAAYELTQRCAGFGWSAVWRNGYERPWVDHAAVSYGLRPFQEHDRHPIAISAARRYQMTGAGRHHIGVTHTARRT